MDDNQLGMTEAVERLQHLCHELKCESLGAVFDTADGTVLLLVSDDEPKLVVGGQVMRLKRGDQ
jgi:hypothetical protein